MDIESGRKALHEQGLNLFAVLNSGHCTPDFMAAVERAGIPLEQYPSLVLLGHAGRDIWKKIAPMLDHSRDPVDEFSKSQALQFVARYLDGCPSALLYPGLDDIPLQQLGAAAGWHHPSPLGLGVNSVYGTWFGYRAAVLVGMALPAFIGRPSESPCQTCADKPCVAACPTSALAVDSAPDVTACVDYRLAVESPCASKCLARLACPVGRQFRYGPEQLGYFYRRSLETIREYRNRGTGTLPER